MIKPNLFDVVEMLVDLPELGLQVGDRGAIVDKYYLQPSKNLLPSAFCLLPF